MSDSILGHKVADAMRSILTASSPIPVSHGAVCAASVFSPARMVVLVCERIGVADPRDPDRIVPADLRNPQSSKDWKRVVESVNALLFYVNGKAEIGSGYQAAYSVDTYVRRYANKYGVTPTEAAVWCVEGLYDIGATTGKIHRVKGQYYHGTVAACRSRHGFRDKK